MPGTDYRAGPVVLDNFDARNVGGKSENIWKSKQEIERVACSEVTGE